MFSSFGYKPRGLSRQENGFSSPFAQPYRRRQQPYYTEDELYDFQRQQQQKRQRLQLQREREAAAVLQQRKHAELQHQEQQKQQRTLEMIRAKIATRTLQRAWRAYCQRRDIALQAKREAAALVITRAIRNFPAIIHAKKIAASLRALKHIAQQVEDVDPATAVKIGAGITVFENTMEKLVAKIDLIGSWGSPLVRYMRKQIILRANERIAQVCGVDEHVPSDYIQSLAPSTNTVSPTSLPTTSTSTSTNSDSDPNAMDVSSSARDQHRNN